MAISSGLTSESLHWLDELGEDGVDTVQIREKHLCDGDLLRLVELAMQRIERAGSGLRVLVNGRADIAVAAGADGVHLPSRGVPTVALRRRFPQLLVGRSTHRPEEVRDAAREGAHYVTFSPVRATPSKQRFGPPQGVEALRSAVRAGFEMDTQLPVVALGGLSADDVADVVGACARGLAGIRVFRDRETRLNLVKAWRKAEP